MRKHFIGILLLVLTASAETISWDASPSTDVTGYKVYWSATGTNAWTVLGVTSGLSFVNTNAGSFYYYVTATNACCESDPSVIAHRPKSPRNTKTQ